VYVKAPVLETTDTAPPPVDVAGTLYDRVRPTGSVNDAEPVTTPVSPAGLPTVAVPATGVPGETVTVTTSVTVSVPFVALTVNVSVVELVAA